MSRKNSILTKIKKHWKVIFLILLIIFIVYGITTKWKHFKKKKRENFGILDLFTSVRKSKDSKEFKKNMDVKKPNLINWKNLETVESGKKELERLSEKYITDNIGVKLLKFRKTNDIAEDSLLDMYNKIQDDTAINSLFNIFNELDKDKDTLNKYLINPQFKKAYHMILILKLLFFYSVYYTGDIEQCYKKDYEGGDKYLNCKINTKNSIYNQIVLLVNKKYDPNITKNLKNFKQNKTEVLDFISKSDELQLLLKDMFNAEMKIIKDHSLYEVWIYYKFLTNKTKIINFLSTIIPTILSSVKKIQVELVDPGEQYNIKDYSSEQGTGIYRGFPVYVPTNMDLTDEQVKDYIKLRDLFVQIINFAKDIFFPKWIQENKSISNYIEEYTNLAKQFGLNINNLTKLFKDLSNEEQNNFINEIKNLHGYGFLATVGVSMVIDILGVIIDLISTLIFGADEYECDEECLSKREIMVKNIERDYGISINNSGSVFNLLVFYGMLLWRALVTKDYNKLRKFKNFVIPTHQLDCLDHIATCDVDNAKATVVLQESGIQEVQISESGSDYIIAPTVSFRGGNGIGATAKAVLEDDEVVEVIVTDPGYGYDSPPTVLFSGGGKENFETCLSDLLGLYDSRVCIKIKELLDRRGLKIEHNDGFPDLQEFDTVNLENHKDGKLDKNEYENAMQRFKKALEEVYAAELCDEWDDEGECIKPGEMDMSEFTFEKMDINKSGFIEEEEWND